MFLRPLPIEPLAFRCIFGSLLECKFYVSRSYRRGQSRQGCRAEDRGLRNAKRCRPAKYAYSSNSTMNVNLFNRALMERCVEGRSHRRRNPQLQGASQPQAGDMVFPDRTSRCALTKVASWKPSVNFLWQLNHQKNSGAHSSSETFVEPQLLLFEPRQQISVPHQMIFDNHQQLLCGHPTTSGCPPTPFPTNNFL